MKGKTIVDTEKLQELLKLVRAFEDPLGEAERATERGKYMAYQLNMEFEEESSDRSKLYFWDENKLRSDIAAEYAYKAPVMRSCKVAKGQQGRYKKAYVEIEGLADKMPQESE